MLRVILNPQAKRSDDAERGADLFKSMTAWEATASVYISLSDNIRVSVLLEHASDRVGRSFDSS